MFLVCVRMLSNHFRLFLLQSQQTSHEPPGQVASAQGFLSQRMCITSQWGKPPVSVFTRTAIFQCEHGHNHVSRAVRLLPNRTGGHIQSERLSHEGSLSLHHVNSHHYNCPCWLVFSISNNLLHNTVVYWYGCLSQVSLLHHFLLL